MRKIRIFAAGLALAAPLALAACETPPPMPRFSELTYGHLGTFRLDVARIEVASEYVPPLRTPNVEHLMPAAPEAALKRWAADRLQAAGRAGTARFVIKNGAVTETPLKMDTGFSGLFKQEQQARYEAYAEASLEIFDERGFQRAYTATSAKRGRTLAEGASLNDRDRMWFELVETLLKDFDAGMGENVRRHLAGFLF